MRILFLTGREFNYPRNQYLLYALRQLGDVRVVLFDGLKAANLRRSLIVTLAALPGLLWGKYDLVFVGLDEQLLTLPAGLLKAPTRIIRCLSIYI